MSKHITDEQIEEFQEAFHLFDTDGDGAIGHSELKSAMKSLGQEATDLEIEDMIKLVDVDGDNQIDFQEFLDLMVRKMKDTDSEEEMLEAFKLFDRDGDGFITQDELRRIMAEWGVNLSDKEAEEMIRFGDYDEDGLLSFEEFSAIML